MLASTGCNLRFLSTSFHSLSSAHPHEGRLPLDPD